MNNINLSLVRKAIRDESGQIMLPWMAVVMSSFLGVAGLTMDVGRAYIAHSQLQNQANAAALAAAGQVYYATGTSDAYNTATTYSGSSGDNNASGVGAVTTSIYEGCVNTLMPSGVSCSSSSVKNAVQVVESTTFRNYIMPIFWGSKTMAISATATASMQGQANGWNVAVIVDATDSMVTSTDSNCETGSASYFTCALESVQTLLQAIPPCSGNGSACTPSNSQFRVALFSFPNRLTSNVGDFYGCSSSSIPTPEPYTLPTTNGTSYPAENYGSGASTYLDTVPSTGNVDAQGFESDYFSTTSTNNLNSSAEIVKEIGGASGCSAMNTAGGEGTYYGGVIYAAEAALQKEQSLYSGSKNAIILISDGQAQAPCTKFPSNSASGYPTGNAIAVTANPGGQCSQTGKNLTGGTFGDYPDFHDECQQAIMAGQAATTAGTRVYAVAYGSEASGCVGPGGGTSSVATDSTVIVSTGLNQSFSLTNGASNELTPCITMENIASSLNYFYSDWNQSGSGSNCVDNSHTTVNLSDISLAIAASFTKPRLLPNIGFLYGVQQTS
jgi:Flp pilus assembly protein TadG